MKKWFFVFLVLAVFLPLTVEAGGPFKVVTGSVTTSKGAVPTDQDLSFEAYIVGRESDVLRQNSTGCGYSAGSWWITVSNLTGTWAIGEVLRIEFSDAGSGESNVLEVMLDGSTTQNCGDFSLPVELSSFTAMHTSAGVQLRWRTESEVNNIGFAIYRSEKKDGEYVKIAFVNGRGNSAMPADYQYLDRKIENSKNYFYFLEDVDIAGDKGRSKIIAATALKGITWAKIKAPK